MMKGAKARDVKGYPGQRGGGGGRGGGGRGGGGCGRIMDWKSDKPVPDIPNTNFATLMLNIFAQYKENIALIDANTEQSCTYADLRRKVFGAQAGLRAAGLRPGDAVLLISRNNIGVPFVTFSVMLSEAVCVLVNPSLTVDELVHIVRVSEAKWAIVNENVISKVEAAFHIAKPNSLKGLWVIGDVTSAARLTLGELVKSPFTEPTEARDEFNSSTTAALMLFSSGTTGLPKGVLLSHQNLLTTYMRINYLRSLSRNKSFNLYESTLLLLPLYHIYGHNMMDYTLFSGGKGVILSRFTPTEYFEAIQTHKVTMSPTVPHIIKFLTETPLMAKYDISSIKTFGTGSTGTPEALLKALSKKSGKIAQQGYGLTESCGIGSSNGGPPGYKPHSVGKLSPYFQGKVVDVETGQLLSEGEEGELCLRSPSIMMGYAKDPQATAHAIDSEGWLHTGDLCYYDEDNFLFITDRIKDLIKVKGFQVSPAELENIIMKVRGVDEVAVAGVPNERLGETPRAWVVPTKGASIDTEALKKYVADRVAPYKQLAGGVEVVEKLPRNKIGKILKRELRKSYFVSRSKL